MCSVGHFTLKTMKRDRIGMLEEDFLRTEVDIVKCVTEIVSAYVSNHSVPIAELPNVIKSVHSLIGGYVNNPYSGYSINRFLHE